MILLRYSPRYVEVTRSRHEMAYPKMKPSCCTSISEEKKNKQKSVKINENHFRPLLYGMQSNVILLLVLLLININLYVM